MNNPGHELEWEAALKKLSLQSRLRWNESLKRFNTWRIGGAARCLVDVENLKDLSRLLPFLKEHRLKWFLIGKGSNLLIPDSTWEGVIVHLSGDFKSWEPLEEGPMVRAGSGLADVTFVQRCVPKGWSGMEFMIGIPGTIGGAVATNAGAHGGETAEFLSRLTWMDLEGEVHENTRQEFNFDYRFSELDARQGRILVSAIFELRQMDAHSVRQKALECQRFRIEKQPYNQPSCGSVFKNPPGDHAARLIEASGLKGSIRGSAQISPKHSNFIVNLGRTRADDILWLMDLAQERVLKDHGRELIPEVQILQ